MPLRDTDSCQVARSSRPRPPQRRSPDWFPSKRGAAGGGRPAPAARRNTGGCARGRRPRRHRHQPDDAHRATFDERRQLRRCDPRFSLLTGDIDFNHHLGLGGPVTSQLGQRRVRRDRMDVAHAADQVTDLTALQLTDEVPAKAVTGDILLWRSAPARDSRRRRSRRRRPARRAPPPAGT